MPFVAGADSVRRRAWWLASRTHAGRALLGQRDLRLVLMAATHALAIFAIVLVAPMALLLLGPLLLGVPHVIADVRYLLRDPARPLAPLLQALILLPLLALTFVPVFFPGDLSQAVWIAGAISVATGIAASRRLLPLLAFALFAAALLPFASAAILAFVQIHNAVAVGLWLARWRGPLRAKVCAAALLALPAVLLASGLCDALLAGAFTHSFGGLTFASMLDAVAPGAAPAFAARAVALFAYAQAVHYVVWLRLLPQSVAPGPAPLSFARGLSALRRSLGLPLFVLAALLCIALPTFALFDPLAARDTYLVCVAGHGWLELAVLAHLACRT